MSTPSPAQNFATVAAPLLARYGKLGSRERALILITGLAALAFCWNQLIFGHQRSSFGELSAQIDSSVVLLGGANSVAATLGGATSDGQRAALQRQRSEAIAANAKQQLLLSQAMTGLVQPADVSRLLADVLKRHPGLRLVKAESIEPQLLGAKPAAAAAGDESVSAPVAQATAASAVSSTSRSSSSRAQLYQHGLKLELEGSYLDAYDYLHELERLPWGLRWDRVSFEVTEHPIGRLVLQLHTVSQGPEWIGV